MLKQMLKNLVGKKEKGLRKRVLYNLSCEENSGIDACYDGETNFDGEKYCEFAIRTGNKCIKVIEIPKKNLDVTEKKIKVTINPDTITYTHWYLKEGRGIFKERAPIYKILNRELKKAGI